MSRKQSVNPQARLDEASALFSPCKRNKLDSDESSPLTGDRDSYSEEELFHLELSDEGKRIRFF